MVHYKALRGYPKKLAKALTFGPSSLSTTPLKNKNSFDF